MPDAKLIPSSSLDGNNIQPIRDRVPFISLGSGILYVIKMDARVRAKSFAIKIQLINFACPLAHPDTESHIRELINNVKKCSVFRSFCFFFGILIKSFASADKIKKNNKKKTKGNKVKWKPNWKFMSAKNGGSICLCVCVGIVMCACVCMCVCECECVSAQPDVKYVWTTLLCKMPNILQLVDVALSPLFLPLSLAFLRFLHVRVRQWWYVCGWVDCCARKSHLNYNDDATHTHTHETHKKSEGKIEVYAIKGLFAYSNGKYPL